MSLLHQIQPLLHKLGLNTTEQSVYMAGLTLGPSTILQLAEYTKLKRLTVHQAVHSLIEQGVMMETYYGKRRLVYPNNADGLRLLLEEKKFALRQLEQELESSKSVFDAIITARNNFSNTRLYHGIEGINTTLLEMANDGQEVSLLYDANALANFVDEKLFHRSYMQRMKKKIRTKLILPD
jgi:sugar-specific transcriptional regulator TrmB